MVTLKTTSIRELKHDATALLAMVANGESVEVRRRNVPVAVISPVLPKSPAKRPDFRGRLKSIYGDTLLTVTGTDLISEDRGDR